MDFSLDDDQEAVRAVVRTFVEREVPAESAAQWDRDDHIPRDWLKRIAALGVCALTVPEEYGGLGKDVQGMVATILELGRRSAVLAALYIQNACYGSINIAEAG